MGTCRPNSVASAWCAVVIGAITAACAGPPLLHLVWASLGAPPAPEAASATSPVLLLKTVLYALCVGVAATAAGCPVAWCLRSGTAWVRGAMLSTLLVPSYFAYAGWNVVRGPGTWTGDALARLAPEWTVLAGQVLGVAGVALWAWPISALILVGAMRRLPAEVLDSLRMEQAGAARRVLCLGRALSGPLALSVALTGAIAMGSPIPLHLAQIETSAMALWRALDLTDRANWGGLAIESLPLLLPAAAVAWWVSRLATRAADDVGSGAPGEGSRPASVLAAAVAAASIGAPALVMAASLRRWSSLGQLWTHDLFALLSSASVAVAVALGALVLSGATWIVALDAGARQGRAWPTRFLRLAMLVFAFTALIPGILLGAEVSASWAEVGILREVRDGPAILIAGHLARYGVIPMLVGLWLARSEPRELTQLRRLDAGGSIRGWVSAALPGRWPALVAGGLGAGAMSFQDIEVAVMVQPPGLRSLSQVMLEQLHYLRDEELAAACLNLLAIGLSVSVIGSLLLARVRKTWEHARIQSQ